ncbi:MAG: 50S ribosomal protein L32 [Candidatus Lernaella stagnicola]|nr:50S ribosomal protein L32 [Candidatus Lernaella stagnicola]
MAVPKRKISHARGAKRKAGQRKAKPATLIPCPNCQEKMIPHRVCPSCGFYKGREIIEQAEE